MGERQIEALKRRDGFHFQLHPEFNWPSERLQAVESQINRRVQELLDLPFRKFLPRVHHFARVN